MDLKIRSARREFNDEIGEIGERTVRKAIEIIIAEYGLPWKILDHNVRASGADIVIIHNDTLTEIASFEVTNFRNSSYYLNKRAHQTKENLQTAPVKGIITTHKGTIRYDAIKILSDIPICYLGKQILPQSKYDESEDSIKEQSIPYDDTAIRKAKDTLLTFFSEIELIHVVSQSTPIYLI